MLKAIKSLFSDKSKTFSSFQPQVGSFNSGEPISNGALSNLHSESHQPLNRQEFDQFGAKGQIPQSSEDFDAEASEDPITGKL